MKYYSYLNGKTGKLLFRLSLFVLLLLARDTMITSAIMGLGISQFLMVGCLGLLGIGFLFKNRCSLKEILTDKRMLVILASAAILLVPMLVKQDWQLMYFTILFALLVGIFLSYFSTLEDAAKTYVVIMTALGVYSILATYILRMLPDKGILQIPTFTNSGDVLFHNFGLAFVSDTYVKNRNFGIFREPGVYQFFIILALFLNNYTISWRSLKPFWTVNILLGCTMLTTFATGGVAELGLLVLVVFFEKKLYEDKKTLRIAIALVIALILVLTVIIIRGGPLRWELYDMVINKFSSKMPSSTERAEAIVGNVKLFLQSPLAGNTIRAVLHGVRNNTSSTTAMFAIFGVVGGVFHIVSWLALIWKRERKLWANLMLVLIMFASFNTQNLMPDVFFWIFPMMALTERVVLRLETKKKR